MNWFLPLQDGIFYQNTNIYIFLLSFTVLKFGKWRRKKWTNFCNYDPQKIAKIFSYLKSLVSKSLIDLQQCGPRNNDNEEGKSYSPKLQNWSLTIRWFNVVPKTLGGGSYPFAEMQLVYSTAPANWAYSCKKVLTLSYNIYKRI